MSVGGVQYRFGLFETDLGSGRLLRQGEPVRLQEQPFQVLLALLERHGQVVTRDDLRQRLWPGDTFVEFDKSLGVALAKVRAALGDDAANPRFVETVPRRGYRFIAPVDVTGSGVASNATVAFPDVSSAGLPGSMVRGPAAPPVATAQRRRWFPAVPAAAGIAALALMVAGIFYWRDRAAVPGPTSVSLVVADFGNTTGDVTFDGSLRRATTVVLRQSPFLNVLADSAVRDALQDLGRPPAGALSAALARDVCRHGGGSAVIDGSIARPDNYAYIVVVSASRCDDGRLLARETRTFARREDVLAGLGEELTALRGTLGESRETLKSFNVRLEVATTESPEALRAYDLGVDLRARSDNEHAIPALKTAVSLDPQFAMAYAQLGSAYSNMGNTIEATPYLTKAFELRDRATEPERLYITGRYFDIVAGDLEKGSETYRMWTRMYPDEWLAFNALANDANLTGRYNVAVDAATRAVALGPKQVFGRVNLMTALFGQNRFADVAATARATLAVDPDNASAHLVQFVLAVHAGDEAAAQREVDWGAQHPQDSGMPYVEAEAAGLHGHVRAMRQLFHDGARVERGSGNAEGAANALAFSSFLSSMVGLSDAAVSDAAAAVALARSELVVGTVAVVDACSGRPDAARQGIAALDRDFPLTTVNLGIFAPMVRGALASGGSPADVTQTTSAGLPYELGQIAQLQPAYVRGLDYLSTRAPDLAVIEFQKIVDHVGVDPITPLYALAYLGIARADRALGKMDESRKAYATFLEMWKDADRDVPVLRAALSEYAAVREPRGGLPGTSSVR